MWVLKPPEVFKGHPSSATARKDPNTDWDNYRRVVFGSALNRRSHAWMSFNSEADEPSSSEMVHLSRLLHSSEESPQTHFSCRSSYISPWYRKSTSTYGIACWMDSFARRYLIRAVGKTFLQGWYKETITNWWHLHCKNITSIERGNPPFRSSTVSEHFSVMLGCLEVPSGLFDSSSHYGESLIRRERGSCWLISRLFKKARLTFFHRECVQRQELCWWFVFSALYFGTKLRSRLILSASNDACSHLHYRLWWWELDAVSGEWKCGRNFSVVTCEMISPS